MDQYSTVFDQTVQQESDLLPDDELFADACFGDTGSPGTASRHQAERADTLGVFRGIIVGAPIALILWAPILAAGYYLAG